MKNKVISLFGDNKIVPNKGVKYSELLEQFMAPFAKELESFEYYEYIIGFSMNAWNFGNMKQILPPTEGKKVTDYIQKEDIDYQLLEKMIEYKIRNFKEYTNFIVDFEIEGTDKDPVLTIITQEKDDYLAAMMEEFDDDAMQADYDENFVNRNAIIIKPLQPFIDWLNTLYPKDEFEESDFAEPNIYLVTDDIVDLEQWLKKKFDKFFMMELNNWQTNKKGWPKKRSYKMFKQWFQVSVSDSVFDTEKEPVSKSEY